MGRFEIVFDKNYRPVVVARARSCRKRDFPFPLPFPCFCFFNSKGLPNILGLYWGRGLERVLGMGPRVKSLVITLHKF